MAGGRPVTRNLDFWFRNLMVVDRRGNMEGVALSGWKEFPMKLLLRIISLRDDRTVIVASGVVPGGEMLSVQAQE